MTVLTMRRRLGGSGREEDVRVGGGQRVHTEKAGDDRGSEQRDEQPAGDTRWLQVRLRLVWMHHHVRTMLPPGGIARSRCE